MCAVSMVYDLYRQPNTDPIPWPSTVPATLPWSFDTFEQLKDIIKRLDSLDKKLGLEHCEDPSKALWMEAIEKRLAELERKEPVA